MVSNRLAFAALSVACVVAAAAGGYYASRPAEPAAPAAVQAASSAPAQAPPVASAPAAPGRPVQEAEAVVSGPAAKTPAPPAAPTVTTTKLVDKTPAKGTVAARREPLSRQTNTRPGSAQPSPAAPVTSPAAPEPSPPIPAPGSAAVETPEPGLAENVERAAPEPPRAPEPPMKVFEDLEVSADSVIGLQTETRVSSETASVEDRVDARVTRDVTVGDRVAIPAGSRAIGSVIQVARGGRFKERARLGILFHTLVLADGMRLPISTDTVFRDGEAPTAAAKVGGAAVGGAILGAILGRGKGAAIGAAAAAGAGATAAANSDRSTAEFPPGAQLTVRLVSPVMITIERTITIER